MKFEKFDSTDMDNFALREIDSFVADKELNNLIKHVYLKLVPRREKTYLIAQIGKALGVTEEKTLFPFAAAAELMMGAAMNADDSLDNNESRYGEETLWLRLGKDKTHILSNCIYGLIFEILKKYRLKNAENSSEYEELTDMLLDYFFTMHQVQYETMSSAQRLKSFDLLGMEQLAYKKAGILFEFCASVPAIITNTHRDEMKELGKLFGVALQYASDTRDFIFDADEVDKKEIRYEDLYTHQPNLILTLTLQSQKITEDEKRFFLETWTSIEDVDKDKEKKVYEIIQKSESIESAKKELQKLGEKLKAIIITLPDKEVQSDLIDIVDRVCRL